MMDYEILTLFSVEEFTELSHGMTAKSTKSKRKVDHPLTGWGDTNQPHLNAEKKSHSLLGTAIAFQTPQPINSKDFLNHATIQIVR